MLILSPTPHFSHHLDMDARPAMKTDQAPTRSMHHLLMEAQELFQHQWTIDHLLSMSRKLHAQLRERLRASRQCMLPSHNYTLPTGHEQGVYLALEIGGSTLRIALVELDGRGVKQERLRVRRMECSPIDATVRGLEGATFFDWMAGKIRNMLAAEQETPDHVHLAEPIRMGIAWSFPLDQTSIRSGNVLGMGKGFHCSNEVLDHDLGEIIEKACKRANLNVQLDAIVNDSSAALLSRAYVNPTTRLAVILGTGINAAIHLPISSLHRSKFGSRPMPHATDATHVLVNIEFSMFGKNIFPTTRWDEMLNANHKLPNYQPLEYLIAGGYMGEIVRLIITEATTTAGLFNGSPPPSLLQEYALDTRTLADLENDHSASLLPSCRLFQERHPSPQPPSYADVYFIREITRLVSHRSAIYFTVGVHALSTLLHDVNASDLTTADDVDHATIGCNGSVINKYPGYMDHAQGIMDRMIATDLDRRKRVVLEKTNDSSVIGAGIAAAMATAF